MNNQQGLNKVFDNIKYFIALMYYYCSERLPKSYVIEIEDVFGEKTIIDDIRLSFRTYDAAKSYSEFYSNIYGKQYKFRVVGDNRIMLLSEEPLD